MWWDCDEDMVLDLASLPLIRSMLFFHSLLIIQVDTIVIPKPLYKKTLTPLEIKPFASHQPEIKRRKFRNIIDYTYLPIILVQS